MFGYLVHHNVCTGIYSCFPRDVVSLNGGSKAEQLSQRSSLAVREPISFKRCNLDAPCAKPILVHCPG